MNLKSANKISTVSTLVKWLSQRTHVKAVTLYQKMLTKKFIIFTFI